MRDYNRKWSQKNPDKIKKYKDKMSEYNKKREVVKKCPVCEYPVKFRKDYINYKPTVQCQNTNCNAKLKIIKEDKNYNLEIYEENLK